MERFIIFPVHKIVMNIRDIYQNRDAVLAKAFEDLQAETQKLTPVLDSPEVLQDDFVLEWLALNYVFATDFGADGRPIIGRIGGIIPLHPSCTQDKKRVLAVAAASMNKVAYGHQEIKAFEKKKDKKILSELENRLEREVEFREDATIVNGLSNIAHYDFSTGVVAVQNPLELLETSLYLLLRADGVTVLSDKCLEGEQYVFNVPVNDVLFRELSKVNAEERGECEKKIAILKENKSIIVPDNFIAGFHITYKEKCVIVRPVIGRREMDAGMGSIEGQGLQPEESDIAYIGASMTDGVALMEKLLD